MDEIEEPVVEEEAPVSTPRASDIDDEGLDGQARADRATRIMLMDMFFPEERSGLIRS